MNKGAVSVAKMREMFQNGEANNSTTSGTIADLDIDRELAKGVVSNTDASGLALTKAERDALVEQQFADQAAAFELFQQRQAQERASLALIAELTAADDATYEPEGSRRGF
jgi:uncharacterized protein involved in exopolysaccharide biosynthesis